MVPLESKQHFLRGFVFTLSGQTLCTLLYFYGINDTLKALQNALNKLLWFITLASLRPIMGFITETPLETASFSTINLLKCINKFTVQIFGVFLQ